MLFWLGLGSYFDLFNYLFYLIYYCLDSIKINNGKKTIYFNINNIQFMGHFQKKKWHGTVEKLYCIFRLINNNTISKSQSNI